MRRNNTWILIFSILCITYGIVWSISPFRHRRAQANILAPLDAPFVKRSSSAIAITSDGAMLLVVNPDSSSISAIELSGNSTVTEIAVGTDPRTVTVDDTSARAYVANRGSSSVSVIDLVSLQVITEIEIGARPYGVVVSPDGHRLYIAEQGVDRLNILDTGTFESLANVPTLDRPSGLALSSNGETLYMTHLFTNKISVLPLNPPAIYLPLVLQAAPGTPQIVNLLPVTNGNLQSADLQFAPQIPTINPPSLISLFPNSNLLQSIVIAPDGQTAYVPHTRSNSTNQGLTLDSTVFPTLSLVDLPTRQHLVGQHFDLFTLDPPAVGLPFDAAFTPNGRELWVVNAASNDVTVIDLENRQLAAHIEVGDNPRGIVISPDGGAAYVNNTLAGTVSVIDATAYTVTEVITTTNIPLDPTLLLGKQLFNSSDDPRMGKDQWMSCNTCHFDGENDRQTWFLGFAGPRNTTSLLGMGETLPLRWSGEWDEAADSEFAIRMDSFGTGLIKGPFNCSLSPPDCVNHPPNVGLSSDLDALASYLDSLVMPLSPGHMRGEPLSAAEQRGQVLFEDPSLGCANCHPSPLFTDGLLHDVGTATPYEKIGPAFNTPSLRHLYDTAPYFHDGSATTLFDVLTRPTPGGEHNGSDILTETDIDDLIAYLLALPYE